MSKCEKRQGNVVVFGSINGIAANIWRGTFEEELVAIVVKEFLPFDVKSWQLSKGKDGVKSKQQNWEQKHNKRRGGG